jgi:hypothetical protein
MMERHRDGRPKFNEEAHALSFIYDTLGYRHGTADAFIRRMWTAFDWYDVRPSDLELSVWHLPSEKRYGIRRLFGELKSLDSLLWTAPPGAPLRQHLGRKLGVPSRTRLKLFADLAAAIPHKARRLLGRI